MASVRHKRRKACLGKRRYDTEDQALCARRLAIGRGAVHIGAYKCPHCAGWHIGHRPMGVLKHLQAAGKV